MSNLDACVGQDMIRCSWSDWLIILYTELHLLVHFILSCGALGELSVYPKALSTQEWSEVSW